MKKRIEKVSVRRLATLIYSTIKSDRDTVIGIAGETGSGKSTLSYYLAKAYSKIANVHWGFDRMTWERKEMMRWIDGEPESEKDPKTGLKKGQVPEYSVILPDELFHMFYTRNWHDDGQINAISVFNTCRDRHLLVLGNIPHIWDLDSAFRKRLRFYIYVVNRGVAWVFEQEANPFTKDPWNVDENRKIFRMFKGNPTKCPNFLFEVHFDDWIPEEKKRYLEVRNEKRVLALNKVPADKRKEHTKSIIAAGNTWNYMRSRGWSAEKISALSGVVSHKTVIAWCNKAQNAFEKYESQSRKFGNLKPEKIDKLQKNQTKVTEAET